MSAYSMLEGDNGWVTLKPNQDGHLYIETLDGQPDAGLFWKDANPPKDPKKHGSDFFVQLYVGDFHGHAVFRQAWQDITRLGSVGDGKDVFRFGTVQHGEPIICDLSFVQAVSLMLPVVPGGAVAYSTHLGLADFDKHENYIAETIRKFGQHHKPKQKLAAEEENFLLSPPIYRGATPRTQYSANPPLPDDLTPETFRRHYKHLVTCDTFMHHHHRYALQQAVLTLLTQCRPPANQHVRRNGTKIANSQKFRVPQRSCAAGGLLRQMRNRFQPHR